jgi:hypothetical protein
MTDLPDDDGVTAGDHADGRPDPQGPAGKVPPAEGVTRGGEARDLGRVPRLPSLPGKRSPDTPDGRGQHSGGGGAPRSRWGDRGRHQFLRRPARPGTTGTTEPGTSGPGSSGAGARQAPGSGAPGPAQGGQRVTKKAAGRAGKALGNKVAPGIGGKIGGAVGTRAAAAIAVGVPGLLVWFFILAPLLLGDSDDPLGGFSAPGLVITSPDADPDAIHRDIPQAYLEHYLEAAARNRVPWPVLAALGKATTDHGRFSPFDDACPARDPLRNAELAQRSLTAQIDALRVERTAARAAAAAAESAYGEALLDASEDGALARESTRSELEAARQREQASEGPLRAAEEKLVELVVATDLLGSSHRRCLRDRDPGREASLPPGAELLAVPVWDFVPAGERAGEVVPAPDGFRFDVFWGRWVRDWDDDLDGGDRMVFAPASDGEVVPFDGPMMLAAGAVTDPNQDRRNLAQAVFALAEALSANRNGLGIDLDPSLAAWAVDAGQADQVWGQTVDLLPIATLFDDPAAGCPFDPAAPTAALIEAIWRCELSGRTLYVVYDVTLSTSGDTIGFRQLPGDAAVEALVTEALLVAAGFSTLGADRCDAEDEFAGVFPLSAGQAAAAGVDRCDRVGNITAAARLVAATESVLPPMRSQQERYDPLLGGWALLGDAAGGSSARTAFAINGPALAALSSPTCRQAAATWAQGAVTDPSSPMVSAWLSAQPTDAVARVAVWEGSRFDGGVCAPLAEATASRLALGALAELDSDRMYSNLLTTVPADLLALRVSLLSAAQPDSTGPRPSWGRDSFVPRLSHLPLEWPAVVATPLASARLGLERSYFAVPMAVRYGGTVPQDERAGTWLLTAGALWGSSSVLVGADDIDALLSALVVLGGDPDVASAVALAEAADVPLGVAVRFLDAYRQLFDELGRAPTSRELLDLLFASPLAGANGLVCPVDGARPGANPGFINDWQFCRGANCSRRHEGNDIFAPTGTPIRAVADATIIRVRCVGCATLGQGWGNYSDLGGITVTYRTDNGWEWYNAHLHTISTGIAPGVRVAQGAIVGTVGQTGNARTTPPHNHLGLFIGGRATNPFPITSVACGS